MLVIGLTGGIGSGKTTVANLFANLGAPVIDADVIAKELTQPGQPSFMDIIDHFEEELLQSNGTIDRAKLRDIIFEHPEQRRWLEALLHPLILKEMECRIQHLKAPYCIAVIPLLFEVGTPPFIDRILTVDTPEHLQIERAASRDKSDNANIQAIIDTQVNRDQRTTQAQDIISNDGVLDHLLPQVESLHILYTQLGNQK